MGSEACGQKFGDCQPQGGRPTSPVPYADARNLRVRRRYEQQVKVVDTPDPNGMVGAVSGVDLSPCLKAGDSWAAHGGPDMLTRR